MTIGSFAYRPGFNPYQRLFTESLESAGLKVRRIPPTKWFPLSHACSQDVDVLHLDWHDDWYRGKNRLTRSIKALMYHRGLKACKRLPVVWTAHNLTSHDSANLSLDHEMTQRLINACRGIMVMSDSAGSLLRSRYSISDSVRLIKVNHGHYIDCYPNVISRSAARSQLGIGESEFVYLALGSLRPYKGYTDLVRAFAAIATPSDRLVIAGSASDKDYNHELQTCIADEEGSNPTLKIDLHARPVVNDELQVFFKAADVCALPFQRILNSGSLLLAMSFGKPVVAPRIGSVPEVAHTESYMGYETDSEHGLAEALSIIRQQFDALPTSNEIIRSTRAQYDWKNAGLALSKFYAELLTA